MTNEQIENEATSYVNRILGLDYIGEAEAERAFKAGASWRINSVWHKVTLYGEDVQCNVEVIAHCKNGSYLFGRFGAVGSYHEYLGFGSVSGIECKISDILEYAYLDDLLPDGKEDRNG